MEVVKLVVCSLCCCLLVCFPPCSFLDLRILGKAIVVILNLGMNVSRELT